MSISEIRIRPPFLYFLAWMGPELQIVDEPYPVNSFFFALGKFDALPHSVCKLAAAWLIAVDLVEIAVQENRHAIIDAFRTFLTYGEHRFSEVPRPLVLVHGI